MIYNLFDRAFKLLQKTAIRGDFVEFGVYQGYSLIRTMKMIPKYINLDINFFGFDTFEEMPLTNKPLGETLQKEWGKGTFTDTSLDRVNDLLRKEKLKAHLVKGFFKDLKPLSNYGIKKIAFAHIDVDIYEDYRDALDKITPFIQIGTVIIFDEYCPPSDYRYQNIRFHGPKAISEWVEKIKINLHLIRFDWTCGLCVIVNEDYLKKYGKLIESLRNDNIIQSFSDFIKQVSMKIKK